MDIAKLIGKEITFVAEESSGTMHLLAIVRASLGEIVGPQVKHMPSSEQLHHGNSGEVLLMPDLETARRARISLRKPVVVLQLGTIEQENQPTPSDSGVVIVRKTLSIPDAIGNALGLTT